MAADFLTTRSERWPTTWVKAVVSTDGIAVSKQRVGSNMLADSAIYPASD